MKHYIKYDKTKTYYYITGGIATPEEIAIKYPASQNVTYVMETDDTESIMMGMDMLPMLRTIYGISTELTENEAIAEIERLANIEPEQVIDDNTRIADALEDLVVLNMPDEEE